MGMCQITMRSTVMEMDVKVTVIFPETRHHYERIENKKYPVLYLLHGFKEDCSSWINLSTIYLNARDLDLFVVMPSGMNASYANTKYNLKMQQFISEELPIRMKNLFPISDRKEDTFIMGESMGGFGTWYTTLKNPGKYGKAVPLSGAPMPYDKEKWEHIFGSEEDMKKDKNDLRALIKELSDQKADLPEYFLMCGSDDRGYPNVSNFAEYVKKECPNISLKTEYWPGKHDYYFWNEAIPKALEFLGFKKDEDKVKII